MANTSENQQITTVIDRIHEQHETLFNTKVAPEITCNFITKRPYSLIAKLNISSAEWNRNLYAKIPLTEHTIENIQKEYYALQFFFEKFQNQKKYGVIKPLTYYKNPPALVTEEATGSTLSAIFSSKVRIFASKKNSHSLFYLCKEIGKCLSHFQSIWPIPEEIVENTPYHHEDTVSFIHNQLSQCLEKGLLNEERANSIRHFVNKEAISASGSEIKITGMHSDFILSNLLTDGSKVYILDFGGFKLGPSCRDVANFLYSLDILQVNPLVRPCVINNLKKGFMEGYGWSEKVENLPLFYLFQIREILGGLLEFSEDTKRGVTYRLKMFRRRVLTERLLLSTMKGKSII